MTWFLMPLTSMLAVVITNFNKCLEIQLIFINFVA